MNEFEIWKSAALIALITVLLRFFPFVVWGKAQKTPKIIKKFGRLLPCAIIGMLVVYCLKNISFKNAVDFVPEFISCGLVAILYIIKRNTLISIVLGTLCYMLLIQFVF